MKKSLIAISAVIAASAVLLTSCQSGKNIYVDLKGKEHELYTDENGDLYQDDYGFLYEYKTNKDGETFSVPYSYPEVSTNKSRSKIENCWVKIDVPKGWKAVDSTTILRMSHTKGDCVDINQSGCQIEFETFYNMTSEEKYEKYKKNVDNLFSLSADIMDVNEFETKICGKDAKAISYRVDSNKTSIYYYVMSNDYFSFTIKAVVHENCFKDSQSIVDLLESCIELKKVANVTTTTSLAE